MGILRKEIPGQTESQAPATGAALLPAPSAFPFQVSPVPELIQNLRFLPDILQRLFPQVPDGQGKSPAGVHIPLGHDAEPLGSQDAGSPQ